MQILLDTVSDGLCNGTALDDKEYEGNLISLLRNSGDFVRNNSRVRFVKEADYRVDKPDYADRAVTEAIVNAIIHRDYILIGSEIHIDMYDDRLEIQSPGGMYDGRAIQDRDIHTIGSARRNPVIADLFHRMKFMERRGSGLTKILNETAKLPGYEDSMKPEFFSTPSDFRVVLKNVNYSTVTDTVQVTAQDTAQDNQQVNQQDNQQDNQQVSIQETILQYCAIPRGRKEITEHCGYKDMRHFSSNFLKPLLESGRLRMTIPDKPNSRNQKYIAAQNT